MSEEELLRQRFQAMMAGGEAFENEKPRISPYEHKSGLEYAHVAWLTGWDTGKYDSENGLVHTAGAYVEGLQYCVICGCVLVDDRNAMSPDGMEGPKGWAEGPVTVIRNGCQTMFSVGAQKRVPKCKPS